VRWEGEAEVKGDWVKEIWTVEQCGSACWGFWELALQTHLRVIPPRVTGLWYIYIQQPPLTARAVSKGSVSPECLHYRNQYQGHGEGTNSVAPPMGTAQCRWVLVHTFAYLNCVNDIRTNKHSYVHTCTHIEYTCTHMWETSN
jgi:hypothetical protein